MNLYDVCFGSASVIIVERLGTYENKCSSSQAQTRCSSRKRVSYMLKASRREDLQGACKTSRLVLRNVRRKVYREKATWSNFYYGLGRDFFCVVVKATLLSVQNLCKANLNCSKMCIQHAFNGFSLKYCTRGQ